MPRIAIKEYDTSFFHIMVQGIRKEYVFKEEEDIKTYLRIIYKYIQKYKIKIIAYCILNNHAHLLIYVEDIKELSTFMLCINTSYAKYYNYKYKKKGYVFRNRYRAEPIYENSYLINCIIYIHQNPVKANLCSNAFEYKYSSYREYNGKEGKIIKYCKDIFKEINSLYIEYVINENTEMKFMDYIEEPEYIDKSIILKQYLDDFKLNKYKIKKDKKLFREICYELKEKAGLTNKEIGQEFNMNPSTISRILSKNAI